MDKAYAIYDTINLCFPDTKTNKSKITTTMTTNNVACDHDTVEEGVKSWMESVQSIAASASSSFASHNFLVKISGHTSVLQRLLFSSCNGNEIITARTINISSLLRVSQPPHPFKNNANPRTILLDQDLGIPLSLIAAMALSDF